MLSPAHRRLLILELMQGIEAIGPEYESFGTRLVDFIVPQRMLHRGINEHGHPVGHVVDSVSETGDVVAEYGAEQGYFTPPFSKVFNDLRHARDTHPQVKKVLLFSSQKCGPKAQTKLTNLKSRVGSFTNFELEIYDSRRQAEFIVDRLLLNDHAVAALAPFLPPLEKASTETAATKLVPRQSLEYVRRPDLEQHLAECIRTHQVAVLAGLSGSGKSETAVAVTSALAAEFELVVWVSAEVIKMVDDLQAVEVERRGHRLNVLHLLRDRSCLLILDDLKVPFTPAELKPLCGDNSAILVTRQSAHDGDIRMPHLGRPESRAILEQGIPIPCPETVFEVVWKTVGGHPLALRLMNAGVREGNWEELPADCAAIGQYPDTERVQRLADRLLGRVSRLLEKELAFVIWCQSPRLDRAFTRKALGPIGVRKLDGACLLAADRSDVIRLHDIVYSAVLSIQNPLEQYVSAFDTALDRYVEHLAFGDATSLAFLTFRQLHEPKLEALLRANPGRSSCLYCLAHAWSVERIELPMVGDPILRANDILGANAPSDLDVSAVCEAVEAIYRTTKHISGIDTARLELEKYLEVFSTLATAPRVSPLARRTALHHQAKALRNLKRYEDAIQLCEKILTEHDSPATILLLARLLASERDPSKVERAKALLFELLERAKASPDSAEISVTLAAIETLGWWQLKKWFREALQKYGSLAADYIIASSERGFDHASVAFAAIGRELRYNDPDAFASVFKQLPPRTPEEAADDRERAAWGDILLSASEIEALGRSPQFAADALRFYEAIIAPVPYHLQQRGHALVLVGRFQEAVDVLRPVVNSDPNPWNRYWLSKALFALGDHDVPLQLISDALADTRATAYRATLLEHRWEIRRARSDPAAIEDLREACDCCSNEKHKASLVARLQTESMTNQASATQVSG